MALDTNPAISPATTTAGRVGTVSAPHRVVVEVSHRTTGGASRGGRTIYRVTFEGEVLLTSWEPDYSACRALLAKGHTGIVESWRGGAKFPSMVLNIETGAKRSISEPDGGSPKLSVFAPYERPADDEAAE